jgi:repressor LexA
VTTIPARQQDALRFIIGFLQVHGHGPSYREIGDGLGLGSKHSVHRLIEQLEKGGHVRRLPRRERSIRVLTQLPIPRGPDGEPLYFVRAGGLAA